jgi:nucleotide-binding STING sensor domain-containing protein
MPEERTMARCFVIGPMGGNNLDSLHWLANVVRKLLPDWEVTTPDAHVPGNIMDHVIKSCDQADLVVANTTGNNPNVLYEIAILDALGRACIPVKIRNGNEGDDLIPFDRAAYRVFNTIRTPSREDYTELEKAIQSTRQQKENGETYSNPITNYFGVPLSELSSAFGIARGYYVNFVQHVAPRLPKQKAAQSAFDPRRYTERRLEILIPKRLDDVTRDSIAKLLAKNVVKQVILEVDDRKVALFEWVQQKQPTFRWVDIPTALSTLRGNVFARLGRDADTNPDRKEFKTIEADEIEQFRRALQRRIDTAENSMFRDMVKLTPWGGPPSGRKRTT